MSSYHATGYSRQWAHQCSPDSSASKQFTSHSAAGDSQAPSAIELWNETKATALEIQQQMQDHHELLSDVKSYIYDPTMENYISTTMGNLKKMIDQHSTLFPENIPEYPTQKDERTAKIKRDEWSQKSENVSVWAEGILSDAGKTSKAEMQEPEQGVEPVDGEWLMLKNDKT